MKNFISIVIAISLILTFILPTSALTSDDSDWKLGDIEVNFDGQMVRDSIYIYDMVYGDDKFVIVGGDRWGMVDYGEHDGLSYTSKDGKDWTVNYLERSAEVFHRVIYADKKFIAISDLEHISLSDDGEDWTEIKIGIDDVNLYDILYDGEKFIAVGEEGYIISSEDGYEWDEVDSNTAKDLHGISYGNDKYVAVGEDGIILISDDGEDWEKLDSQTDLYLNAIIYAGGKFVAKGISGIVLVSKDGANWEKSQFKEIDYEKDDKSFVGKIVYGKNKFIINDGYISDDGIVWDEAPVDNYAVAYGDNKFLSASGSGSFGIITESHDGEKWLDQWMILWKNRLHIESLAYGNDKFIAPASLLDLMLSSENGHDWALQRSGISVGYSNKVIYADNKFVAIGNKGNIFLSEEGEFWEKIDTDIDHSLTDIIYDGNMFIAVGNNGTCLLSENGGYNWEQKNIDDNTYLESIIYDGDKYISISHYGETYKSKNGEDWDKVDSDLYERIMETDSYEYDEDNPDEISFDMYYGSDKYLLVCDGNLLISDNATNWEIVDIDSTFDHYTETLNVFAISFIDEKFVAFVQYEEKGRLESIFIYESKDGTNWFKTGEYDSHLDKYDNFNAFAYGDDKYIIASKFDTKILSIDTDDLSTPIIDPIDDKNVKRFDTAYDVDSDKNWKIKFNSKIDEDSIQNIKVLDSYGSSLDDIDVELYDSKTVIINAPQKGYSLDEKYTIVVEDVVDLNGKSLERKVVKDFVIEDYK